MRKVFLCQMECSQCHRLNFYDPDLAKDYLIHCTFCTAIINHDRKVEAVIFD